MVSSAADQSITEVFRSPGFRNNAFSEIRTFFWQSGKIFHKKLPSNGYPKITDKMATQKVIRYFQKPLLLRI